MASVSSLNCYDIDFECSEEEVVKDSELSEFNSFESCEVEFPDDLSLEDIDAITEQEHKDSCKIILQSLPLLKFVHEENIPIVTVDPVSVKIYQCSNCNKPYERKHCYEKHIKICVNKNNVNEKKNTASSTSSSTKTSSKSSTKKNKKASIDGSSTSSSSSSANNGKFYFYCVCDYI